MDLNWHEQMLYVGVTDLALFLLLTWWSFCTCGVNAGQPPSGLGLDPCTMWKVVTLWFDPCNGLKDYNCPQPPLNTFPLFQNAGIPVTYLLCLIKKKERQMFTGLNIFLKTKNGSQLNASAALVQRFHDQYIQPWSTHPSLVCLVDKMVKIK